MRSISLRLAVILPKVSGTLTPPQVRANGAHSQVEAALARQTRP